MRKANQFHIVLSDIRGNLTQQLRYFALLNLGMVQSLASGVISATDMSHGVQLPDLFEVLPAAEAWREFLHELETMRALCMSLLATKRPIIIANHMAK